MLLIYKKLKFAETTSFEKQRRGRGSLLFSKQRADRMSLYTMRQGKRWGGRKEGRMQRCEGSKMGNECVWLAVMRPGQCRPGSFVSKVGVCLLAFCRNEWERRVRHTCAVNVYALGYIHMTQQCCDSGDLLAFAAQRLKFPFFHLEKDLKLWLYKWYFVAFLRIKHNHMYVSMAKIPY